MSLNKQTLVFLLTIIFLITIVSLIEASTPHPVTLSLLSSFPVPWYVIILIIGLIFALIVIFISSFVWSFKLKYSKDVNLMGKK